MLPKNQNEPQDQAPIVDLGYYVHLVKSRWIAISLFSLLCTAISVLVALAITPTYKATATLLIESTQKKAISIEEIVGIDTRAKEYYLTQFEILKSNQVAMRVIDKLNLIQNHEFNPSLDLTEPFMIDSLKTKAKSHPLLSSLFRQEEDESMTVEAAHAAIERNVLKRFKSNLSISPIPKTQLVKISFESQDPELSARVANEVGLAFIENNLESKLIATEQATGWINQRLSELKQQLDDSEQALLRFLQQQELIDDSGIVALTSSELSNLTDRIAKATDKRIETQALYNALKGNESADVSTLASISLISNHPQVRDIRQAESNAEKQVSELSKRYGPKHDKMIQAKAQLAAIQVRAKRLINKLVNGIGKELASAKNQESLLKSELLSKKEEFQSLSVIKREYDALKREVDTNAKLYDLFLTRQKETSATSDFSAANARFSDYAMVPEVPYKPNRMLIVLLTLVGSIGFAVCLLIILDTLNSTIESVRDFENKLGLLPIGGIPLVKSRQYKTKPLDLDALNNEKLSVFQESVDSIRTSLFLSLHNSNRKLLAISSSVPSEGKTTTAIALAMSFSKLEKVLIIDCDLRKPSLSQRFGLGQSQPGLSNVLLMKTPVEDCIVPLDGTNLDVLCAGMLAPNPQELLSSRTFTNLVEKLETHYDRIIIDTPPILPVKDAFVIGKLTKGILLVMKANSTTRSVYKHSMTLFAKHEIAIDGVVLNRVPAPRKGSHTYSEYANYTYEQTSRT